ncbi:MAG: aspartate carbamoyltransferase [Methylococcales bacterium]|nr:aspartate carbamoyltransferase [Methylococcales bacterium]
MKHFILIVIGLLLMNATARAQDKAPAMPAGELTQRMQQAVPYRLDQTVQTFTKTVHGGVQHVIVKIPENNEAQIRLIQAHLRKTVEQLKKGDFSLTEGVHGKNMPGLTQLKLAEPDDIRYEYKALKNGAQIHYSSEYPQYVQALHEWFVAQSRAHGNAVVPEHERHHSAVTE